MIRHLARRHDGEEGVGSIDDLLIQSRMMKYRRVVTVSIFSFIQVIFAE